MNCSLDCSPVTDSFFIFVDELEIRLGSKRRFARDARLIRDLVVTAHRFNQVSQQQGRWLKVICAIRSEVLLALNDYGKEIEKPLFDFGRELNWYNAIPGRGLHPLLQMACHKIRISERSAGISGPEALTGVWERYFRNENGPMRQTIILNRTWFRPRDIVRLLTLAQDRGPQDSIFTDLLLSRVMKQYSLQSWREIVAELALKYTHTQQRGIAQLLIRCESRFDFEQFARRFDRLAKMYTEVDDLVRAKVRPADLLSDLYRVGAIGNVGQRLRFAFRQEGELSLAEPMVLHSALATHFGAV